MPIIISLGLRTYQFLNILYAFMYLKNKKYELKNAQNKFIRCSGSLGN